MLSIPTNQAQVMWVPVIPYDGTEDGSNHADLPPNIQWQLAPGTIARIEDGMPAVAHIKVYVHPDDVQTVRNYLVTEHGTDSFAPDEHDRVWCLMMEHEQHDYFKSFASIRQRFRNISGWANMTLTRKRAIKRVLLQLVYRGYTSSDAQTMHDESSMETDTETSGTRDGKILRAKYVYGLRTYGLKLTKAQVDIDVGKDYLTAQHAEIMKTFLEER